MKSKDNNSIAIFLGHPAHFHMFKLVAKSLIKKGWSVTYLIKRKDILEDLVRQSGVPYVVVRKQERKQNSKAGLMLSMLKLDWNVFRYLLHNKPKILIGTYCPIFTRLLPIPFISCNEDDADVVSRFAKLSYPGADIILNPIVCNSGKWDTKALKYPSYQELAYLHPNHFKPSEKIVERYGIATNEPYFILRFASLHAHHDSGIQGINTEVAQKLIDILSPHGRIYITSERELEPQFEPYRIHINPLDMHHVMAFASVYIGDSQTMAAEAAVLGVPFIRYNDFVGRIGYLRELEDTYHLGYGIRATKSNDAQLSALPTGKKALYDRVEQLVQTDAETRKSTFQERRLKMLAEKIDYAKFLTWFVENYPAGKEEAIKADQAFWNRFK